MAPQTPLLLVQEEAASVTHDMSVRVYDMLRERRAPQGRFMTLTVFEENCGWKREKMECYITIVFFRNIFTHFIVLRVLNIFGLNLRHLMSNL